MTSAMLLTSFAFSAASVHAETGTIKYGDISGDGKVDIEDVTYLTQYLNDQIKLTDAQQAAADVNQTGKSKGKIDQEDQKTLQGYINGSVTTLPVKEETKVTDPVKEISYGDVNGDGSMDIEDYLLVSKYVNGSVKLDDNQLKAADVYQGGKSKGVVDMVDRNTLMKAINGVVSVLPDKTVYGDLTGDGKVDVEDATLLTNYLNEKAKLTSAQRLAADVDQADGGLGEINKNDQAVLMDYINGKITSLPNFAAKEVTYGDVNGDGSVDIEDYMIVSKYVNGSVKLDDEQLKAADVYQGGKSKGVVDIVDRNTLIKAISGVVPKLPDKTLYGDLTGDGKVDVEDSTLLTNYLNDKATLTNAQLLAADVNQVDKELGEINENDQKTLMDYINGKVTMLPITVKQSNDINYGDVNGDGKVDVEDTVLMNQHIHGTSKIPEQFLPAADLYQVDEGKGVINEDDVSALLNLINGSNIKFPITTLAAGDLDADTQVTINDVIRVNKFNLGLKKFSATQSKAADVDQDGTVTGNDALLILKRALEIIPNFEKKA